MIVSVLDSRDLRRPRLAFAIARVRREQTPSIALVDATAASNSTWRSERLAGTPGMTRLTVVSAASQCLQPVLDALGSSRRDMVIDIDETESFAARSALVAAKVLVVAMTSAQWEDAESCVALRDRIERIRLFNPRLKVLLAPLRSGGSRDDAQRHMLQGIARSIPAASVAKGSLGELDGLRSLSQGKLEAETERDVVALCAELFANARRPIRFLPWLLSGQRKHAETNRATDARATAFPQRQHLL